MSTERRFIFANGSSIAVNAGLKTPIDGPVGDDMADAFGYAVAAATTPGSFREAAAKCLSGLAAQASGLALFHVAEALRLAALRPLLARMRHRPGLYSRPKMKRAERVARNFAAADALTAAAAQAAVGAQALRGPR